MAIPLVRRVRLPRPVFAVVCVCATIASCESITEVVAHDVYNTGLSGRSVRPDSIATNGGGEFSATLSSDTSIMTYQMAYSQLSSAATQVHLHGPAVDTVVAAVIMDLAALPPGGSGTIDLGTSGSASGSIDLELPVTNGMSGDSLRKLMMRGLVYVDVHTVNHSGGEIRGQLRK